MQPASVNKAMAMVRTSPDQILPSTSSRCLESAGRSKLERDERAFVVTRRLVPQCADARHFLRVVRNGAPARDDAVDSSIEAPASGVNTRAYREPNLVRIRILPLERGVGHSRRIVVSASAHRERIAERVVAAQPHCKVIVPVLGIDLVWEPTIREQHFDRIDLRPLSPV